MDKVGVLDHSLLTPHSLPVQDFEVEKGGFSRDGKVVWVWSECNGVSVFTAPHYSKLGWVDTDQQILVGSCELHYKTVKLFVLVFKHQSQSTVAVVSQQSGQLLQAISIRAPVTCICEINETVFPGLFCASTLQHFTGAVCLGCEDGCVFVLDLGLQTLTNQSKATISAPRGCTRIHITTGSSIVTHINAAAAKDEQLALNLNCKH